MPIDGEGELHLVPYCVIEVYTGVTRCPDGSAQHCSDLNNRGHDDWPEITVWPKKIYHPLTTGREFRELEVAIDIPQLNSTEKKVCSILGLKEWELGVFLRQWTPTYYKDEYPTTVEQVAEKLHTAGTRRTQKREYLVIPLRTFLREHGL